MNRHAKFMLIGSGVTAAAMALAQSARHSVANYFVSVALDRQIPPHPLGAERQLVAGCTDEAMLNTVRLAGKALSDRPHETIELLSRDGTRLVGHWVGAKHPKRVIIAMHGWRSAWSRDFGVIADFFYSNDCSVLYAEQRGQGGSGGEYMSFGLAERHDCLDWIHWVNEKSRKALPVYLCGISMGASTVLMAGGLTLPDNVRGIISDCGYTSAVDIWKHVAKSLHLSYGICGKPAGRLAQKRLQMAMDAESCPQALSRCHIPVLFIHGTDDRFVPIEMTYDNYKACVGPKRLFVVPGAEHGMSYLVDTKGYEKELKAFWTEFDNKIPS